MAGMKRRVKPRLVVVCYSSYALLFAAYVLPYHAGWIDAGVTSLGVDHQVDSLYEWVVLVAVMMTHVVVATYGSLAIAKWAFVAVGLMTAAEAQAFLPTHKFPDFWMEDSSRGTAFALLCAIGVMLLPIMIWLWVR